MVKQVIIDADYSTDVGDFGGVAIACAAHRLGWIDVIGFIANASYAYTPGAISAQAQWWGLSGQTYGAWKGYTIDGSAPTLDWIKAIYDNFPHSVGLADTITDSTVAYRTMLAGCADGSVEIVGLGYTNTLAALLNSEADGISALNGHDLIAAKVKALWLMGGQYPSGPAEWNFKGGATAVSAICAASNDICTNWPSPIRFVGFELGDFTAGGTFGRPVTDMVSKAYTVAGHTSGRTAWDEQAVLACVQDGADFAYVRGSQTVNTTTGGNTWTNSPTGKDAYLTRTVPTAALQGKLNALIAADVTATPLLPSWSGNNGFIQIKARSVA